MSGKWGDACDTLAVVTPPFDGERDNVEHVPVAVVQLRQAWEDGGLGEGDCG